MGKLLVIVESPAKAKTINKYLGKEYIVKSSVGHIRDLPKSGAGKKIGLKGSISNSKKTNKTILDKKLTPKQKAVEKAVRARETIVRQMGLDPENGWIAQYEILPDKEKILKGLKMLADKADAIFLATDMDREGEAIAWHLQEAIGGEKKRFKRVIFSEITKKAISQAFSDPGVIDMNRVKAQQARRFLDRVVGFMLSPLLWKKIARGLSAGRVQSVAVRLVIEREKEIHAFIPEEYWEAIANLKCKIKHISRDKSNDKNEYKLKEKSTDENKSKNKSNGHGHAEFKARVVKYKGKAFRPGNKQEAVEARIYLEAANYCVSNIENKPTKKRPYAPFITSTLQQAASIRLGFSVKKTMLLAQRLYEAGYISYMRTDSTNLSTNAITDCRSYISQSFGDKYLPENPVMYKNKKTSQEAHEAIRPSDVNMHADNLKVHEKDQIRVYDLIWRQFVACQMKPAEFDATVISITAGDYELRAAGRVMRFDGWMRILPLAVKKGEDDEMLPKMIQNEELELLELDIIQHFTRPPARYNEASLVKELEKRGIGRPSTYASIISTIQDRGYVCLNKRRFYAEKMGDVVTERLVSNFNDIMNYGFTADMEQELDVIAHGNMDWKKLLDSFYSKFKKNLDKAYISMRENNPSLTDITCPECGRNMCVRIARTGVFLGCSGYTLPIKERCKFTVNLVQGEEVERVGEDDGDEDAKAILLKHRCSKCKTAMDSYLIDENRKLHICGNNPDCNGFEVEMGKFRIKGYDGPVILCDKCNANMELKAGRFGKFFGCTNYPKCTNTRKLLRSGEPAPPKIEPIHMKEMKCVKSDGYFILRDGAAGLFLASNLFPKSRETRSPLVQELARHKHELDPKYHYIANAPQTDPHGNKMIIRFKRKEKVHYLMSEINGKPSGWTAYYINGKWVVKEKKHKKKEKLLK